VRRYFDTSALLPYYRPEPASEACEALLLSSTEVCISDLVEVEFASVLARLVRTREFRNEDAIQVQRAFLSDVPKFRKAPIQPQVWTRAQGWLFARTTSLRTLDALHLAAAAEAGTELVTTDATLAAAAHHFGIPTLHVA